MTYYTTLQSASGMFLRVTTRPVQEIILHAHVGGSLNYGPSCCSLIQAPISKRHPPNDRHRENWSPVSCRCLALPTHKQPYPLTDNPIEPGIREQNLSRHYAPQTGGIGLPWALNSKDPKPQNLDKPQTLIAPKSAKPSFILKPQTLNSLKAQP